MPTHVIRLSTAVPWDRGSELAKRIFYVSPEIEDFTLLREGDHVTGVKLGTVSRADPAELSRKLDTIVAKDVLPLRIPKSKTVWTSPHPNRVEDGLFAELESAGEVIECGEGMYALGALFTDTMSVLDSRIRALAVGSFGAARYRYPTLVPTDALRRGGYLDAFPQYLMTASRFHADIDAYDAFVSGLASADDAATHIGQFSQHLGYCLPPTMCFHTYHQLSGQEVPGGAAVITSRGKSFRFESRYRRSLERLWDFTIREIVFLGDRQAVVEQRQRFMAAILEMVTELGFAGHVEVANDPFFCNDLTPERMLAQHLMELKYELRLPVEGGRTIAGGSFNIHGDTFGSAFGITLPDGTAAHTACAGLGLERLTYAFLCQHGLETTHWPATVREGLQA
ncbi:hypothetical protein [Streptomyces prunicolor]|uniref:hypothetical protein n=1 Tax=Streptomyces prunicolor TaxID=67348 RepID=UPI0034161CF2